MVLLLAGCVDPDGARRTLEQNGFGDIKITGYRLYGCGDEDAWRTGFTAKRGPHTVSGIVCRGLYKGSTVRFD